VKRHLLEETLKKKNISKRQFAKMLKIEYANVFRYFRDGYDPKVSTLQKWAKHLGVSTRDLIPSD